MGIAPMHTEFAIRRLTTCLTSVHFTDTNRIERPLPGLQGRCPLLLSFALLSSFLLPCFLMLINKGQETEIRTLTSCSQNKCAAITQYPEGDVMGSRTRITQKALTPFCPQRVLTTSATSVWTHGESNSDFLGAS